MVGAAFNVASGLRTLDDLEHILENPDTTSFGPAGFKVAKPEGLHLVRLIVGCLGVYIKM